MMKGKNGWPQDLERAVLTLIETSLTIKIAKIV